MRRDSSPKKEDLLDFNTVASFPSTWFNVTLSDNLQSGSCERFLVFGETVHQTSSSTTAADGPQVMDKNKKKLTKGVPSWTNKLRENVFPVVLHHFYEGYATWLKPTKKHFLIQIIFWMRNQTKQRRQTQTRNHDRSWKRGQEDLAAKGWFST